MKKYHIISASVSPQAKAMKEKIKKAGINFSGHMETFIFDLAKKFNIK